MQSDPDPFERSRTTRAIDALCGLIAIIFLIVPLALGAAVAWYVRGGHEHDDQTGIEP